MARVRYRGRSGRDGISPALSESPIGRLSVPTNYRNQVAGGAVLPVWVTVHVPRDAPPGEYEGKLTLHGVGTAPVDIPVHLKVCSYTLPDPKDYATWADFIQSPDTLALTYNVPQ